jgi:hypothetical protein
MSFEFLLPSYVKAALDKLDISLSSLRDALRGADNRTLTDLYNIENSIYGRLDVALSTRASESTLSGLNGKFPSAVALADNLANPTTTVVGAAGLGFDGTNWRRLAADTSGRLRVSADVVANPSNLDISLSSLRDAIRGTGNKTLTDLDTDLTSILARLPASLTTAGNFRIAILEDGVGLLKDAKIPNALGVLTGLDVVGTSTNALATVPQWLPSRQPYTIASISVSTTEGSTSIAAPGAKVLVIKNNGDVDVLIGINGAVPASNPLVVRARTAKVIMHKGVTQVNYKVASGSTTIDIEYYN